MFDARYFAYATISALLVISPGATMAVVMETALEEGRIAAMYTVLGVNIGNSTLALSSAFGMSFVFMRWPWALPLVKAAGAVYLTYLGVRGLWFACRPRQTTRDKAAAGGILLGAETARVPGNASNSQFGPRAAVIRGIMTNLLNPPVILFYTTFLPQFIGPKDPFFGRFVVLAATHVSMSLVWLSIYATALGVLAERMTRPLVRRTLEGLTGVLLVGFGVRLLVR